MLRGCARTGTCGGFPAPGHERPASARETAPAGAGHGYASCAESITRTPGRNCNAASTIAAAMRPAGLIR